MRQILCDYCGTRLDTQPWHLALENRRMPISRKLDEDPQPLEREYHFCSLLCLGHWPEKLGPKGPTGPS
jgi:hypothetical protein